MTLTIDIEKKVIYLDSARNLGEIVDAFDGMNLEWTDFEIRPYVQQPIWVNPIQYPIVTPPQPEYPNPFNPTWVVTC